MQKTAALEDHKEAKERLVANNSENSFKWLTEHSRNFLAAGYLSPGYLLKKEFMRLQKMQRRF